MKIQRTDGKKKQLTSIINKNNQALVTRLLVFAMDPQQTSQGWPNLF